MEFNENKQAVEQALQDYLQPIFAKHFSLYTWAGIWADENIGTAGKTYENLLSHLPAVYEISGSVDGYSGADPWQPVCGLSVQISLKGTDLLFNLVINRGSIEDIELSLDDLSDEALELDLAKEFGKKLTFLAFTK